MKPITLLLYVTAGVLVLIALAGSTLTKPMYESMAESTIESQIIKRATVDSMDASIDVAFYNFSRVNYYIEKSRSFFSGKDVDESKYKLVKNEMILKNVYNPIRDTIAQGYRGITFITGLFLFIIGVVLHAISYNASLRRRVAALERRLGVNL